MIFGGHLSKSPAQRLNTKAQLSLSPKLSSKLSPKAVVRLSSVGHYTLIFLEIPKNRLFSGVPLVLQVMISGMGIVVYH